MAVNIFPAPAGASTAPTLTFIPTGTDAFVAYAGAAGVHTFRAWRESWEGTPGVSIKAYDANDALITTFTLNETDNSQGLDAVERNIRLTSAVAFILVTASANVWLTATFNNAYQQGTFLTSTTYGTSQTVTITAATKAILIGGGGGGGAGSGGGGGGGGAGYIQRFNINPGSYPLVVGAGGARGVPGGAVATAGGASTFNGLTANGGLPGQSFAAGSLGGAGGSGGGMGGRGGNISSSGGANGANGGITSGTTAAAGSGVVFPFWRNPGLQGDGGGWESGNGGGGGGGGTYGGGGGGNSGAGAGGGGGGGGGLATGNGGVTGNFGSQGGAGGAGGLIVLNV
jgi:hypothetical protein